MLAAPYLFWRLAVLHPSCKRAVLQALHMQLLCQLLCGATLLASLLQTYLLRHIMLHFASLLYCCHAARNHGYKLLTTVLDKSGSFILHCTKPCITLITLIHLLHGVCRVLPLCFSVPSVSGKSVSTVLASPIVLVLSLV